MKRAETCSCYLWNKLYISLPQVYTLQSSLSYMFITYDTLKHKFTVTDYLKLNFK